MGDTCECKAGWKGDDCSIEACNPKCITCSDSNPNICYDCVDNAVLNLGVCECVDGYDGEDCSDFIG